MYPRPLIKICFQYIFGYCPCETWKSFIFRLLACSLCAWAYAAFNKWIKLQLWHDVFRIWYKSLKTWILFSSFFVIWLSMPETNLGTKFQNNKSLMVWRFLCSSTCNMLHLGFFLFLQQLKNKHKRETKVGACSLVILVISKQLT